MMLNFLYRIKKKERKKNWSVKELKKLGYVCFVGKYTGKLD